MHIKTLGDNSLQCLCIAADGRWHVQPVKYKCKDRNSAYVKDKISPLDPAAQCMVLGGSNFEDQSVQVSTISSAMSCQPEKFELPLTKPDVSDVVHSVVQSQNLDELTRWLTATA